MSSFQLHLLRRTAVALAAMAGFSVAATSQAAVITLTGATGTSCSYSSMSVAPDGSFNVTCTGGTTTTPTTPTTPSCQTTNTCKSGGVFTFSQSTASAPANAQLALFINRSGATAGIGQVQVPITFTGSCTYNGAPQVTATFADGQNVLGFYADTGAAGTCSVGFGAPSMVSGTVDNPPTASGTVAVTVGNGGGSTVPPPPPGTCPTGFTAPSDMLQMTLGGLGNPLFAMAHSGQVVSIPLPDHSSLGVASGSLMFGESAGGAYTPQPVTLMISINKCPGYIDPDQSNHCNITSTQGNYNSLTWLFKGYGSLNNYATVNARGYCWAGDGGPYYINTKWTYQQCAFGAQACGFSIVHNYGPY